VGDAGLFFAPNNIEDMADKIHEVWTNGQLRKNLVQKGYEGIKGLTLGNYAEQWKTVFREIIIK
jgi:glycosyltransferase involved in cell wall biosynthesis